MSLFGLERQFLGQGWSFPLGVDGRGSLALARYENDIEEVKANEKLIEAAGLAGAAYGLIEREERAKEEVILRATPLLDKFMRNLSVESSETPTHERN